MNISFEKITTPKRELPKQIPPIARAIASTIAILAALWLFKLCTS